ncbi:MAG TPA: preprotein translocase subunit SecE [Clostridia bacterium]|nr:preprotein translocase subunit SecE [Clostridia bacterium]
MAVSAKKRAESAPEFSVVRFLREVFDELRKVVWPTWGELYRYTLIVIVTVIVLGGFIGGVDYGLGQIAQHWIYPVAP